MIKSIVELVRVLCGPLLVLVVSALVFMHIDEELPQSILVTGLLISFYLEGIRRAIEKKS